MSKQTYTTGQVLTSAQMTQLQTNDYNQTVSAKVASYTLVASDAGTRITMANASATTITVNTNLFTAGDTLTITNISTGVTTITAGTATVSTAGSLALNQYDSGTLYFTSTGVSIWNGANPGDITGVTAGTGISGGGTSGTVTVTNSMATEITAAGDIIVGTGSGTFDNLPIGTTAQVLTADTTVSPYKVKWATPAASSSGLTFITGASFSAVASVSAAASTFTSTYNCYKIIFVVEPTSANAAITMRMRTSGTDNTNSSYYSSLGGTTFGGASISVLSSAASSFGLGGTDGGQNPPSLFFDISNPQVAKITNVAAFGVGAGAATTQGNATFGGFFNATTQFDSVTFLIASGTMTGYYKIYGYQNS